MALRTVILGKFPAKRLLAGGRVIWEQPTVTIEAELNDKEYFTFLKETLHDPHGYVDRFPLYGGLISGDRYAVIFKSRMTCDRVTRHASISERPAGEIIRSGDPVFPYRSGKYVFTPLED